MTKIFIKSPEDVKNPKVRGAYGTLCSLYGIFLNLVLFAIKYFAGTLSGSVAIAADAFNNLSDAGSSIITLLGFAIASKKPDPDHPYGHGRVEYLAGLGLSTLIIVMGVELGKTSVEKIINPVQVEFSILPVIILILSVFIKFYMSSYNRQIGKKINSAAMQATAADSLSDCISTGVVLISMCVSYFLKINIDGWVGLAVAIFICFAGYNAIKETISPLLGQSPDKEFIFEIEQTVLSHPEVKGIHDLLVHDYGPGRQIISLHAEVDGNANLFESHDVIDRIESELKKKFSCIATIHLDPIDISNPEITELKSSISSFITEKIDSSITIHDFRIVPGITHTNVIFDAVLPIGFKLNEEEFKSKVQTNLKEKHPSYFCVINIDYNYA